MAERVGFEALIAEPCAASHRLVQLQKRGDLSEFRFPFEFIGVF
jgi:hypothetical protein